MDRETYERLIEARDAVAAALRAASKAGPCSDWVPRVRGQVVSLLAEALGKLDEACSVSGAGEAEAMEAMEGDEP